jgi:hypothetical protein
MYHGLVHSFFYDFYNYKQKLQYCFFAFLMLCQFYLIGNQFIRATLDAMPDSEKESLEKLFRSLFNGEHFIYTLFGDKPMSVTNYSTTYFEYDDILSQRELRFRKRWEIEGPCNMSGRKDIYFIKVDRTLNLCAYC